jgi:hypothetical protein
MVARCARGSGRNNEGVATAPSSMIERAYSLEDEEVW